MIKKQYAAAKAAYTVTFSLTTEQVGKNTDIRLLGDFNDWSWDKGLALNSKKKGYEAELELPAGTYQFRYLVNGHAWFNDEAADDYLPTPFFSHNFVVKLDAVEAAPKAADKKAAAAPKAKAAPAAKTAEKAVAAPKATAAPKKAAAPKAAAKAVVADDLKKIEGIGPKIADLLNADGITTFAELAKAEVSRLQTILDGAGSRFKMHNPATWTEQAALAAAGKWDALQKLQDELIGGKR